MPQGKARESHDFHDPMLNSAATSSFLPRPLRKFVARLPQYPGSVLFAAALNLGLKRHLPKDTYRQLLGKGFEIALMDVGARFRFKATPGGFVALRRSENADLSIMANAHDFGLLASGEDDADTLYFERRLVVEGATELALLVKNTLDAIDGKRTRQLVRRMHRVLCAARARAPKLRPNPSPTSQY
jgi:O2-independent ubiquinone biosynthesis accessory factor UbiT